MMRSFAPDARKVLRPFGASDADLLGISTSFLRQRYPSGRAVAYAKMPVTETALWREFITSKTKGPAHGGAFRSYRFD